MPEWEPFDEEERLAIVLDLRESHPALDLDNSLSGELAGPASVDRPDLPVWDYVTFVAAHRGASLSDLAAVRFPVLHVEGVSSVTSIDEELRPLPSHLRNPPSPRFVLTAEAIVRRYAMLHEAGLVEWDPRSRGIRYLAPVGAMRSVMEAWIGTLAPVE